MDVAFGRDDVISRKELKPFVKRTDRHGLIHFAILMCGIVATGALVQVTWGTLWVVPTMLLHSVVLATIYAPVHECSHGTPFRSRWINEGVYWFLSLLYFQPPYFYRYAHATHHTYTGLVGKDSELVFPARPTVLGYLEVVSGLPFWRRNFRWFVRNALGCVHPAERHFLPEDELPRVYREARIILSIYVAIGLIAFYFASWAPITLWLLPRVIGEPFRRWVTVPEHAGRPQVLDLRVNTRTILTPKWFSWLLWNMNFHAEHHISPSVPYHALADLHRVIKDKVPVEIGYWKVTANILRQFTGKGAAAADPGSVLAGS